MSDTRLSDLLLVVEKHLEAIKLLGLNAPGLSGETMTPYREIFHAVQNAKYMINGIPVTITETPNHAPIFLTGTIEELEDLIGLGEREGATQLLIQYLGNQEYGRMDAQGMAHAIQSRLKKLRDKLIAFQKSE